MNFVLAAHILCCGMLVFRFNLSAFFAVVVFSRRGSCKISSTTKQISQQRQSYFVGVKKFTIANFLMDFFVFSVLCVVWLCTSLLDSPINWIIRKLMQKCVVLTCFKWHIGWVWNDNDVRALSFVCDGFNSFAHFAKKM